MNGHCAVFARTACNQSINKLVPSAQGININGWIGNLVVDALKRYEYSLYLPGGNSHDMTVRRDCGGDDVVQGDGVYPAR